MKVKITYQPGEEKWAFFVANCAGRVLRDRGTKIKEECKHPPYRHIYISTKPPEVPPNLGAR